MVQVDRLWCVIIEHFLLEGPLVIHVKGCTTSETAKKKAIKSAGYKIEDFGDEEAICFEVTESDII